MKVSFDIETETNDLLRVILSSGEDAFFATEDVVKDTGLDIEVVEIDLERIKGNNSITIRSLALIAEGIDKFFRQNKKAIMYYYCDDLAEIPKISNKKKIWPQEYRSRLFSAMFKRHTAGKKTEDMCDTTIKMSQGDRPLFMHFIARKSHSQYVNILKDFAIEHYGK